MPDLLDSVQVYAEPASLDEVYFLHCPYRCGWAAEKVLWGFAVQAIRPEHLPTVRQGARLSVAGAMRSHLEEMHRLPTSEPEPVADSGTIKSVEESDA